MDISPRLSGTEWQTWADKLLQRHYGPGEYQKIPDRHSGDAGIEGFTIATGHAYQVYGPIEPLSTKERYENLRTKMTTDIRKFCQNRKLLEKIFGNVKITRWILLVPHYSSKDIVIHARKKTEEVMAADLPYVSPDFRVCIEDEEVFAVERDQLINARAGTISIKGTEINGNQVTEWADENDSLVQTIDGKIGRISSLRTSDERRRFRDHIIRVYLAGQNVLEELRRYPTAFENIRRIKSQKEYYLGLKTMTSTGTNMEIFTDSLKDIREAITADVLGVEKTTVEAIVYEAVSDWIIRCPLDFRDSQ